MAVPIECPCGRRIAVTETQAGTMLACACGRRVEVPSLTVLKRHEAFADTRRWYELSRRLRRWPDGVRPLIACCAVAMGATCGPPLLIALLLWGGPISAGAFNILLTLSLLLSAVVVIFGIAIQHLAMSLGRGFRIAIGLALGWVLGYVYPYLILLSAGFGVRWEGTGPLCWALGGAVGLMCMLLPGPPPVDCQDALPAFRFDTTSRAPVADIAPTNSSKIRTMEDDTHVLP